MNANTIHSTLVNSHIASKDTDSGDPVTQEIYGIDIFCGIGGLTHGLAKGGITVSAGIDIDPLCKYPYEANNEAKFIEKDVKNVQGADLLEYFGIAKFRLIAGCAPCQPFSKYSRGHRPKADADWQMVAEFGRIVRDIQPDFVTMENVPQLVDHKFFPKFLSILEGYEISWSIVDCTLYGVPQTRKRLVLLASRHGSVKLIDPEEFGAGQNITVRSAINHLSRLDAGSTDPHDKMHSAPKLSSLNLRRIKASKPGGTWRDWDNSLRAACHLKDSGSTYSSVYGRMEWDAPAPTMTTQFFGYGNGRFGHPEQDRAITPREAAILQTFPDDYSFLAPGERPCFSKLGRLIGNAVPVKIGEVVARTLIEHASQLP